MQRLTRNLQIILGGCIAAPFCTILKEQGVIRRSGYRNFAEKTNKRASEKKINKISDALQPPAPKTQCLIESDC